LSTSLRLSNSNLRALHKGIAAPAYDRAKLDTGIVHFGPGAFFRAHVAWYVDQLLARDPRWGIAAVSLRTGGLAGALVEQDCLYTLAEIDAEPRYRVIGALREYLVASEEPEAVFARLARPSVGLVTITVTEKGYCLDGEGALDLAHPDIAFDLAGPDVPRSLVGWLAEGLKRRRAAGVPPCAVLSCDNLLGNGPKLRAAVARFVRARNDHGLADWIEHDVPFPATMVDSITPFSDDALKDAVARATGLRDEAPVRREPFTQWVIEDALPPGSPDLAAAGATLTKDVADYECAKLRLLNGAHSALAYLGLAAGHTTIFDCMNDAPLARFVESMMRQETAKTLGGALDIPHYIDRLLERLRNPAIGHRLAQIAADGSMKLPYRCLEPIADLMAANASCERLLIVAAAWMRFVVSETRAGRTLADPRASELAGIGKAARDAESDVGLFLALDNVFPKALWRDRRFILELGCAYRNLLKGAPLPP
jgi:fructuronate reductase